MSRVDPSGWLRVVLDDLGLRDYGFRWEGRRRWRENVAWCDYEAREIHVRWAGSWRSTLYNLLHEAAHALIGWSDAWEWRVGEDYVAWSMRMGDTGPHGNDFFRVLVMVAGFYGFGRWEVMRREYWRAACRCGIDEPCRCSDWRRDRAEWAAIVGGNAKITP